MYVNAPRYLLRKYCILKLIKDMPAAKVLEIGCGAGDLCETLYKKGYSVKGIDFSESAINLCQERQKRLNEFTKLQFSSEDFESINETFDCVFLCEVLEHMENDEAVLKAISRFLNVEGLLICSVPAHRDKFGPSDRVVGHFRRYDRDDIIGLLENTGFQIETIWSYGVPLANLTEAIRNFIYAKRDVKSKEEGSKQSGIKRDFEYTFRFLLNDFFLYPFYLLQCLFLKKDLGTGYLIKARKKTHA